jgi:hypothetical protein
MYGRVRCSAYPYEELVLELGRASPRSRRESAASDQQGVWLIRLRRDATGQFRLDRPLQCLREFSGGRISVGGACRTNLNWRCDIGADTSVCPSTASRSAASASLWPSAQRPIPGLGGGRPRHHIRAAGQALSLRLLAPFLKGPSRSLDRQRKTSRPRQPSSSRSILLARTRSRGSSAAGSPAIALPANRRPLDADPFGFLPSEVWVPSAG